MSASRLALWLVCSALSAGCRGHSGDTTAIVVLFSVSTLGLSMANEHQWCERLTVSRFHAVR